MKDLIRKRPPIKFILASLFALILMVAVVAGAHAQQRIKNYDDLDPDQLACGCRKELSDTYAQIHEKDGIPHSCVTSYEEFLVDPQHRHYWMEDPEITSQGKADERARQFIYWVLHKNAIDDHPALKHIWNLTRNMTYFFVIILAAVIGLGFIIGQRTNFNLNIKIWPAVWKIIMAIVYVTFSAAIVLLLIQLSELLMKFFIENLGGDKLFNIYFSTQASTEKSYTDFIGCRDINIRAQEGVHTELMMLKLTNITYYVMGSMILLRKILLWFLLFVSPFLAILFPFVFIRNIGWIWIGVFFQWLFYGPLFALFLSALATIWKSGIPFAFDFSRVNSVTNGGYVYPTAINILYGGPAQKLQILNNGNYIDTYVEYIITLLMLWAVTFFPWWLLRIFRDYCCDILAAMNNVLLSMYDQWRASFPPIIPPAIPPGITTGTAKTIPIIVDKGTVLPVGVTRVEKSTPATVRIETVEQIKQARTEDIVRSLDFSVTKLTDIARFETNKSLKESATKNIEFLANPVKADAPVERQKFMNIRTELFSRAVKEDKLARSILSSTSTSQIEQMKKKEEILKTAQQPISMVRIISDTTKINQQKVQNITQTYMQSLAKQSTVTNSISQTTQLPQQTVQNILTTYSQTMNQPINQVIKNISEQTHISKEKVSQVLQQATSMTQQANTINSIATTQQISNETVEHILNTLPGVHEQTTNQINQTTVNQVSQQTGMNTEKVSSVIREVSQSQTQTLSTERIKEIATHTQVQERDVQRIAESYHQQERQNTITQISQQTGMSTEKVTEVASQVSMHETLTQQQVKEISEKTQTKESEVQMISQKLKETATTQQQQQLMPVTRLISMRTNISEEKASAITNSLINSAATNSSVVQHIQQETGLNQSQVKTVLTTYSQNINQPADAISNKITAATGLQKEKVNQVLSQAIKTVGSDFITSKNVVQEVATKENAKPEEIKQVMDAQAPIVSAPEKQIEKSIAIPATISLEDYEEVKKMWVQQYEKGEVPVQENMTNREQWIDQDIILITNTLNKLLAPDETMRREGLDDLGFILPIFMINNLKGEELLVYLKAKLEAAKNVKKDLEKEKEIREKLKKEDQPEEELVDLKDKKKAEKPKELHMEMEMDEDEEKAPGTPQSPIDPEEPKEPTGGNG